MRIQIKDFEIEAHFRANRSWTDLRVFHETHYKHVVWGKISLIVGFPGLEEVTCCPYCYGEVSFNEVAYCSGDGECGILEGKDNSPMHITVKEWEELV